MKQNIQINFPIEFQNFGIDNNYNCPSCFLTININLKRNNCYDEILKLQENILKGITSTGKIEPGIYKYPVDRFHFSIINFENQKGINISINDYKKQKNGHIDEIKKILKKFEKREISDKTVQFGYIYTGCNLQSITIQAFPSVQLCQLFDDICHEFNKSEGLRSAKIKDNPYNRFAVNIIRFFRELTFEEKEAISRRVTNFNVACEKNRKDGKKIFFEAEIKYISFVVSDNWLNNPQPEQSSIELT